MKRTFSLWRTVRIVHAPAKLIEQYVMQSRQQRCSSTHQVFGIHEMMGSVFETSEELAAVFLLEQFVVLFSL